MQTIFDSATPVIKSPAKIFGFGLAPARRPRAAGPTLADRAWAAAELNRDAIDYVVACPGHAALDQWAGESAALAAAERGLSFA